MHFSAAKCIFLQTSTGSQEIPRGLLLFLRASLAPISMAAAVADPMPRKLQRDPVAIFFPGQEAKFVVGREIDHACVVKGKNRWTGQKFCPRGKWPESSRNLAENLPKLVKIAEI